MLRWRGAAVLVQELLRAVVGLLKPSGRLVAPCDGDLLLINEVGVDAAAAAAASLLLPPVGLFTLALHLG